MRRDVIQLGLRKKAVASLFGLVALVLRFLNSAFRIFSKPAGAKRILILEPFGLGDAISLEPLLRALQSSGADVCICARKEWKILFPNMEWLDCKAPWSSYGKKYQLGKYFSDEFRNFLKSLRAFGKSSIGIDPRGDIRSIILLHLAGCSRVITLSQYLGSDLAMLPGAAERVPFSTGLHRWELNLRFLDKLRIAFPKPSPPDFKNFVPTQNSKTEMRLGLIPIAPWRGKFWQKEKWRQLIEAAQSRGWKIIGLVGPGQISDGQLQLGSADIRECSSIADWMRELSSCSAVVSLDTGPMHLADALGVPVIALFGQGLLPLWAPSGEKSSVISHQDAPDFFQCHPIESNSETGQKFMARIEVDEVLQAVSRLENDAQ